ncbi:MAG: glucose 1-dehydrogenase [Armatimonadetes bacterium]|nr:glucose 1-dehydrogenase [Armatimonadota bacterium]
MSGRGRPLSRPCSGAREDRGRGEEGRALSRLQGKVALITGAGRGIGRGIAEGFVREGTKVAVNDIDGQAAQATVVRLMEMGGEALAVPGDVADESAVQSIVRETLGRFGHIDILVNNAGIATYVPVAEMSSAEWDRTIAVHLRGAFLCTRHVLPHMLEAGRGKIINIASQRGQKGGAGLAHYAAAKAGIIGFTKSLALEVSRHGIHVNAIAPGPIRTGRPASERFHQTVAGLPIGRAGEIEDVVPTAIFLACDDSSFYVGQTLCPNGGDVML